MKENAIVIIIHGLADHYADFVSQLLISSCDMPTHSISHTRMPNIGREKYFHYIW